jgi:hypothetical protein
VGQLIRVGVYGGVPGGVALPLELEGANSRENSFLESVRLGLISQ